MKKLALLCVILGACQRPIVETGSVRVLQTLGSNVGESVSYLAWFQDEASAQKHFDQARAGGAKVSLLAGDLRFQKVEAPTTAIKDLRVAANAQLTVNSALKVFPANASEKTDPKELAENLLTTRSVVGVNALEKRFPEANGQGVKVAVFDSGIDFGVLGLEKHSDGRQKLVGFYDLSGFGEVDFEALTDSNVKTEYLVGKKTIRFAQGGIASKVSGLGELSEQKLARNYLTKSIDLNDNGKTDEVFPFLVGLNFEKTPAVWVDLNGDGILSLKQGEELTDFNTSFSFHYFNQGTNSSGTAPLAVTFSENSKLQFHRVVEGHGTSCALIIAGEGFANGRLRGMAPKANLVSYLLDAAGQDVYTVDQFLAMFLHAKKEGVDAISISWGFATADLKSARFIGEFLDKEIASAGIVIGIAAGNEGPGIGSGSPDDYMPHAGFAVGAMISEDQARGVYGWTGKIKDDVIFYSSVGPSAGGRQIPDVIAPLMSLVRGNRVKEAPIFVGFGGTSSATPALIGAVSSLISVLKAQRQEIDPRILKLAILNSARQLQGVMPLRQGQGVVDVNAAYDVYLDLIAEMRRAKDAAGRAQNFPYDLRASIYVPEVGAVREGIRLSQFVRNLDVKIQLTPQSLALVDHQTFVTNLTLRHREGFFEVVEILPLQATGGVATLNFIVDRLTKPGVYVDSIEVLREDGLVLLTVPVVIEIPATAERGLITTLDLKLAPDQVYRLPISLKSNSSIEFQGISLGEPETKTFAGFLVQDWLGHHIFESPLPQDQALKKIELKTETLPAGQYEVMIYRAFSRNATLDDLEIHGGVRLPALKVMGARQLEDKVEVILQAQERLSFQTSELELDTSTKTVALTLQEKISGRRGFYGEIDLASNLKLTSIGLRENPLDVLFGDILHMELVLFDQATDKVLHRGWHNLAAVGAPLDDLADDAAPVQKLALFAFPNIVDWKHLRHGEILAEVRSELATPLVEKKTENESRMVRPGEILTLTFSRPESVSGLSGRLKLSSSAGAETGNVDVAF